MKSLDFHGRVQVFDEFRHGRDIFHEVWQHLEEPPVLAVGNVPRHPVPEIFAEPLADVKVLVGLVHEIGYLLSRDPIRVYHVRKSLRWMALKIKIKYPRGNLAFVIARAIG